ncbi:hypothetical protein Scep_011671 [Stephania cephalantha]|uniref:Uncharacterized protein n=1 Tax=Stephania cephalantha TaxID=152367 RepID=A0AAP0P628_9MAGN
MTAGSAIRIASPPSDRSLAAVESEATSRTTGDSEGGARGTTLAAGGWRTVLQRGGQRGDAAAAHKPADAEISEIETPASEARTMACGAAARRQEFGRLSFGVRGHELIGNGVEITCHAYLCGYDIFGEIPSVRDGDDNDPTIFKTEEYEGADQGECDQPYPEPEVTPLLEKENLI